MHMPRIPGGRWSLLVAVLFCAPVAQGAVAEGGNPPGLENYQKYCAVCHGAKGSGGNLTGMVPPPTDFTSPRVLVNLTREGMIKSVREGKAGTAMVGWDKVMSEQEIGQVVDYVRDRLMMAAGGKDTSLGRRVFATNCSVCHGDKGDTAIWARSGLSPAPRNFTTEQARKELSRERVVFSITYGRPETAMPAWGERLSKEEIEAAADYVINTFLFPVGRPKPESPAAGSPGTAGGHQHEHYDLADMGRPLPHGLAGNLAMGEAFYKDNCATCHGENGDGQGKRADFIYPKPRNFRHPAAQHKFNRSHLFEVISKGMPATEMPAWERVLTRQEIANVAEYVFQSFIRPGLEAEGLWPPPGYVEGAAPAGGGHEHMNH